MSGTGMKEKAILAIVGVVALYAVAVGVWFFSAEKAWSKARKAYDKACKDYVSECRMIAQKGAMRQSYEEAKAQMPVFSDGKATDTTWQRKLGAIAEKNLIVISQQQVGKEEVAGEVKELTIDVRNWEGCLEALVKFMHELENTNEGMFDIRALNFRPSSKKGYLKGSFSLTCAFMRE